MPRRTEEYQAEANGALDVATSLKCSSQSIMPDSCLELEGYTEGQYENWKALALRPHCGLAQRPGGDPPVFRGRSRFRGLELPGKAIFLEGLEYRSGYERHATYPHGL